MNDGFFVSKWPIARKEKENKLQRLRLSYSCIVMNCFNCMIKFE